MDKNDRMTDSVPNMETKKENSKRGNPYEVIQIYDTTCNKIRQAREFKISSFEEADANGEVQITKSVEFIIVGNNRKWKMFIPYDEFKRSNPTVKLPGDTK